MAEPTDPNPFQDNLRDLARQSWELEMLISGAAIFFATELPAHLERVARLYFLDLAPSDSMQSMLFPILVYGFFKAVIWVFLAAFAAHFAIRAFWVSLIGLLAAFPKGVNYDQIPNMTDHSKRLMEVKIGPVEPFIHRLDRLANQLFAFAFLVALIGLSTALIYLVFFLGIQAAHFFGFGTENGDNKSSLPKWVGWVIWVIAGSLFLLQMILKKNERLAMRYGPLQAKMTYFFSRLFVPLFFKHVSLLSYIFSSNVSRRRYFSGMTVVSIFVLCAVFAVSVGKALEINGTRKDIWRSHFSSGSGRFSLFDNRYSNRIEPDVIPARVILPAETITEERHISAFVVMPRWIDRRIEQLFPKPETPEKLRGQVRRRLEDSLSVAACQQFFELSVNEKSFEKIDWTFDEMHGVKGIRTFLPMDSSWIGRKNWLTVRVPSAARADSLEFFGEAVFWYFPKD